MNNEWGDPLITFEQRVLLMKFIDEMTKLALPVIEQNGCELVDAEFKKEGVQRILRFYIELKDGEVSLDECASVSRGISELIDESEFSQENFVLEVSSPGVERVLKKESDFVRFSGRKVDVSLYKPYKGSKKQVVVLKEFVDEKFTFESEGKEFEIPSEDVAKINLHFDFEF